jgi:hypothetical protein
MQIRSSEERQGGNKAPTKAQRAKRPASRKTDQASARAGCRPNVGAEDRRQRYAKNEERKRQQLHDDARATLRDPDDHECQIARHMGSQQPMQGKVAKSIREASSQWEREGK